jgi:hypothetical protein
LQSDWKRRGTGLSDLLIPPTLLQRPLQFDEKFTA